MSQGPERPSSTMVKITMDAIADTAMENKDRSCNIPAIYALAIWCDPEVASVNNLAG